MGGACRGSVFIVGIGVITARLINAAGLLSHDIAGDGIGAGAGSAADVAKFAGAALAMELVRVAELHEDGRLLVDVRERVSVQVAAFDGQEAAGIDLADVGDKDEAASIIDALGGPADGLVFGALAWVSVADGPAGMRGGARAGVVVHRSE